MKCTRQEAIGLLVLLWTWALNNAGRDGSLDNATAEDIADGCMYKGNSKQLINGLLTCKWIDHENGRYSIHDWDQWQEFWYKNIDRKEQSKLLMRELRSKRKLEDVSKPLAHSYDNVSNSTNHTTPNHTTPNKGNDSPLSIPPKGEKRARSQKPKDLEESEAFRTFWSRYPKKVAKPAAFRAWLKLNPSADICDTILAGIDRAKHSEQWREGGGRFIPNPATFINQRRWEDQIDGVSVPKSTVQFGAPDDEARKRFGI